MTNKATSRDRNRRERDRLREKRKDKAYLQRQRANRAAQMAEMRRVEGRGVGGQCWDCTKKAVRTHIYCERCLERDRARKRRSR